MLFWTSKLRCYKKVVFLVITDIFLVLSTVLSSELYVIFPEQCYFQICFCWTYLLTIDSLFQVTEIHSLFGLCLRLRSVNVKDKISMQTCSLAWLNFKKRLHDMSKSKSSTFENKTLHVKVFSKFSILLPKEPSKKVMLKAKVV